MSDRRERIASAIRAFVEHPITSLEKRIVLLLIGISEAARTLREDLADWGLRVGHGLVIIGIFSILDALPHLIERVDASGRYLESRGRKPPMQNGGDKP
jgi:hypothetical protein